MAIIKPSKKFIGSEIDLRDAGKYIRADVKQVRFNKKDNAEGAWLYFLPPYKTDAEGNGVWFKVFQIRDNFGDKFKDKYAVLNPHEDPVAHFERNFKIYYPEDAKPVDEVNEMKQVRKRYPYYGRTTFRVLYNVAYVNKLDEGAHVLDLPAFNGASIINEWLKGKDKRGQERPMLNAPSHCIPVFIKLKDGGGAPWQIEPEQSDAAEIPDDLADSENINNLDDVFIVKSPVELIDKLKNMYSSEVFEKCIAGYSGYDKVSTKASNPSATRPLVVSTKATAVSVGQLPTVPNDADDDIPMEFVQKSEKNPVGVDSAKAAAFLRERK
jgi:hypothetical protein